MLAGRDLGAARRRARELLVDDQPAARDAAPGDRHPALLRRLQVEVVLRRRAGLHVDGRAAIGSKPNRSTKIVCLPGFRWPVNGVRPMAPISLRSMNTSAPGTFDAISTQPR